MTLLDQYQSQMVQQLFDLCSAEPGRWVTCRYFRSSLPEIRDECFSHVQSDLLDVGRNACSQGLSTEAIHWCYYPDVTRRADGLSRTVANNYKIQLAMLTWVLFDVKLGIRAAGLWRRDWRTSLLPCVLYSSELILTTLADCVPFELPPCWLGTNSKWLSLFCRTAIQQHGALQIRDQKTDQEDPRNDRWSKTSCGHWVSCPGSYCKIFENVIRFIG